MPCYRRFPGAGTLGKRVTGGGSKRSPPHRRDSTCSFATKLGFSKIFKGPIVPVCSESPIVFPTPCSCLPSLARRSKSGLRRRLGMKKPYGFKGTLLVLRKRNFALNAFVRLDQEDPKETTAILDTGAGPSVVREDILPCGWQRLASRAPKSTHVCDASGQLLKARGVLELSVIVNGKPMEFEFLVVRALSVPLILGMDFQKEHVKAIYPGTESVLWNLGFLSYAKRTWEGKAQSAFPVKGNPIRQDPSALYLSKGVTLAPRSLQAVYVKCGTNGKCLLYERPHKMAKKGLRLHNALATIRNRRDFRIHVMNISDRAVNLPKNFAVGVAIPYDGPVLEVPADYLSAPSEGAAPLVTLGPEQGNPLSQASAPEDVTPKGPAGTTVPEPGTTDKKPDGTPVQMPKVAYDLIPPELHQAVRELLNRYKDLWNGQLGRIDVTPHRITLKEGAKPIRSQPYRTGLHHRDLIKEQVEKQTRLGVIEPSQAEWSFPVVLVPKSDGTPRFCVDYRRLNEVTVKDTYPLPRMDDCIDFLGEATVFSMLDANCGYWQIPVAPEDQDKTTFTCHEGTFRYIRLPFGLTNAPATFQRAIDMILSGVKWKTCLVYLDDIIVFSKDHKDHLAHLEEIFELLARAGVSLKATKCFLFQDEVEYLGHIVGKGQLRVNEKNLVGLREAKTPRTKKDLRSFLGMCNVYRRFVKDYAKVARPLLAMTSTKVPDPLPPFTPAQTDAFEELKYRLTHTPVLALPKRTGQYIVDTDASATQIGCVLLQDQGDGAYKPVGYWSRVLTPAECNYSTTERECLAVVWALFLLRPYLEGTRFVVRTDHTALKWMLHMDGAHGRLARWRLRLAEFQYTVESRPGQHHHAADFMSRLDTTGYDRGPIPDEIPSLLTLANFVTGWTRPNFKTGTRYPPLTVDRILKAQGQDQRCQELRKEMDQNVNSRYGETPEGLLVRLAPLDRAVQIVVPKALQQEVLSLEHEPGHAGHPGMNKMYTSMRRVFYWESMVADVHAFVSNCSSCSKSRVQGRRRTNPLKLFPATEPFKDVCLDLLGPLPWTVNRNRYLLVIVDRFTKLTRVVPIGSQDAAVVASAFLDTWVASYGPPETLLTDNGPQLASTYFRGVCGLLGIKHVTSTTYHPQTQGQVERFNRTIVAQLRTYVEDHQDHWDELVSVLTVAYNTRPQQSTGVAPFEFVIPDRVRTFALDKLPGSPYPKEFTGTARQVREARRAHLRNLAFTVRKNLDLAQKRYKRGYDKRVTPVNEALRIGDWVYVDTNDDSRQKLDQKVKGPYRIVDRDGHTFTVLVEGIRDRVSSDHVARAPTPAGHTDSTSRLHGPQDPVVPMDYEDSGTPFVWERFVGHDRDSDGNLWLLVRWWGYAESEDTWEPCHKFDRAKVVQYCERVGTEPPLREEETVALLEPFKAIYAVWPWNLEPGADLWPRY